MGCHDTLFHDDFYRSINDNNDCTYTVNHGCAINDDADHGCIRNINDNDDNSYAIDDYDHTPTPVRLPAASDRAL